MIKKLLFILLLGLSSLFAEVVVDKKTRVVEGTGEGLSRVEAVNNALIEALGQLNGVYIKKQTIVEGVSVESSKGDFSAFTYNSKIDKVTKGRVDSYSILEVSEIGDGKYEAVVSVKKTKITKSYKTPGVDHKKRRSLVVVPSYSGRSNFSILGRTKSNQDVSQRLTQELVSSLTKTRKFNVLDREANQAYANEKSVLLSQDAGNDEILKLGNVLGADYLVVSNITEFRTYYDKQTVNITGQSTESLKAYATIQYRIIAMATRQVKWSSTSTFEFEPEGSTYEQVYLNVLQRISNDLTYEVIENIYPIKVADVSGNGQVILSQSVAEGSEYEIYTLGKKIYDPYTKEFLGQDEILSGKIKITRKLPKISYGTLIEGKAKKGDICRRVKSLHVDEAEPELTEADKPSDVKSVDGSGGVKLPFD